MQRGYIEYLKYPRYLLNKKSTTPLYFIYFVTQRCTSRCQHCFIRDDFRKKDELTLEEIEKVSKSMDNFLFLFLTGGEPFLRDDLPEIARIYYANNRVRKFQIPSNGSLGDRVIRLTRKTLNYIPQGHLGVTISLDAVGKVHDEIRQSPGLFDKAVATYRRLKELKKEYSNFSCQINVTVSAFNQDYLTELYRYIISELEPDNIIYVLVRGTPRNPHAKALDADKVETWNGMIEKDMKEKFLGYKNFPFSETVNIKNFILHNMNIQMLRNPRYIIPCYAGRLAAVMFSDGDVYPCELLLDRKLGNVSEAGYDFKKIWLSPKAEEVRNYIRKSRCFCTHECFYSTNILFNPRLLPLIFWYWIRMKFRRLIYKVKADA